MDIIPKACKEEIDLISSNKCLSINVVIDNLEHEYKEILHKIKYKTQNQEKYLIVCPHEVIQDTWFFDEIMYTLGNCDGDVRLSQATASTKNMFSAHPFTHFFFWKNATIRISDIIDYRGQSVPMFPFRFYENFNEMVFSKSIKSILSTRQVSDIRDSLFKKINTDSISIFRYLKCNGPDCEDDSSILWYDLIGEYKKTYISFVVETNYGHWSSNSFTEKTLLSFLSGTIPIIFGQKDLISDLKKLGFWIANEDFGFGNGDVFSNVSQYRIEKYSKCVDSVSNMSIEEVNDYYLKNLDKIKNNWQIVTTLFDYVTKKLL